MTFSDQRIAQFRTEGYLVVPGFFNERETLALQNDIERLKQEGALRNVATDGDGKTKSATKRNLQLCPAFPHSKLIRALPFEPKVVSAISQLIGDPVVLHLDQIFLKPGGDGMGTNWHQDNAYFKISDPLKGTAMWIAIHDATRENGTMQLIPSAFSQSLEHSRDPMSDHHIRCYPDENKAVPVELKAGGVIFFCYGTPHCTTGNHTAKDRAGLAYHFLHASANDSAAIGGDSTRPILSGPDASGGVREHKEKVAGTFQREVEQAVRR
jgi:ectoine hydroxylase-related dioxygenase (phytanoyl-CoA dioxygenase family)